MTLEIEGLDRPKTAKVADKIKQKLPQIRLPQRVIFSNGNGASKCDPPHDWLDDPLVALQRKRGPYTFENADEYLDTEAVELYNGWLVQQEMSDIKERGFAGTLHDNMSSSARLLNFGQAVPDLVECLLDDGNVIKPDVCLISWQRMNDWVQPHGPRDRSTLMGCPELVVEIRSPSNRRVQEEAKRERYFANGAQVVWDVDEKKQIIYVYRAESPEESETYTTDDVIDCEPFLPGWCRQVSDLFDDEASVETVLGEVVDAFREEGEKIGLEEGEKVGKKIGLEEGEKIGEQRGKKIGLEEGEKIGEQRGKKIGVAKRSVSKRVKRSASSGVLQSANKIRSFVYWKLDFQTYLNRLWKLSDRLMI